MNMFIFISIIVGIFTISITTSFVIFELIPKIFKEYKKEFIRRYKK